jgi:hypothetical protein
MARYVEATVGYGEESLFGRSGSFVALPRSGLKVVDRPDRADYGLNQTLRSDRSGLAVSARERPSLHIQLFFRFPTVQCSMGP